MFESALASVRTQLGQRYPLVIGGTRIYTDDVNESINPFAPEVVVGHVSKADRQHAQEAVQQALAAFSSWKQRTLTERARYLLKAAAIMRRQKHELSALMCIEAGKTWGEADGDTAEAIDFLEFYAREAIRLGQPQPLTPVVGEDNTLFYIPLGVGVVIPPWNFPLAITTGMTAATIVAGNTAILKPASPTPVIAYRMMEVFEQAGIPPGVINYLPGSGGEIGDFLVEHPSTRFICFTGSRAVGERINRLAAGVSPGQVWLKRVIAEMGGKDAIVVDAGANVDEAAQEIVVSAFGFSGQKCSACSRAILHDAVYDAVAERVVSLVRTLRLGDPTDGNVQVGPVIDEFAYRKILGYIAQGKTQGRLLCGGGAAEGAGYLIAPTVFGDVDPQSQLGQEEIFGPVLALLRAKDFETAVDIANGTEYGLTGALFSPHGDHLEYARKNFDVGNLYFNRKCTGALVGAHPFGGFNMSGTNSKAGGRDYLLLFTQAKVVSERL